MKNIKHLAVVLSLSVAVGLTVVSCAGKKEAMKTTKTAEDEAQQRTTESEEAKRKAEEAKRKAEAEKVSAEEAKRKTEEAAQRKVAEAAAQRKTELTLEAIHFDYDKYNLRPDAQAILAKHGAVLQKYSDVTATIEGHCDERGTVEYNLALGERRAKSAHDYLLRYGIDGKRMKTISYGKERPVDPGHNEDAWWKNRRDEFVVTDPMAGR